MRWQYWAILFFLVGFNLSAKAVEQQAELNQARAINDLSTTTILFDSFAIQKISAIQLEIKIDHSYIGDLSVSLISPSGEEVSLHQQAGASKKFLQIVATTDDLLASLKEQSSLGTWKVLVTDHAKYDQGQVSSITLAIKGDIETVPVPAEGDEGDDSEPIDPQPPVLSGSCEQKWGELTRRRPLEPQYLSLINRCGEQLRAELKRIVSTNRDLGYTGARQVMFSSLDNVDGVVCSVYTSDCIETKGIPSSNKMNCEHTWPQSKGATGIAKSDLHHLYPVESKRNSLRGNYPFCEVVSVTSGDDLSVLGQSARGTKCFEPPQNHKGNVARSMFYFAIRYGHTIDTEQATFFREWNDIDPVDSAELLRTGAIEEVQGNRNPFVDHPEFIALL